MADLGISSKNYDLRNIEFPVQGVEDRSLGQ